MNTSPKRDVEGLRTIIGAMALAAIENKLEKGQKIGDTIKVEKSVILKRPIEREEELPSIEITDIGNTTLDSNGNRTYNNTVTKATFTKTQKDMYEKRLEEDRIENQER